jgi:flagellar protein FlgJ
MTMTSNLDLNAKLALDVQSVDNLRLQAKRDPKEAVKSAAKQFEALFLNILFKSMREATPEDPLFDNDQSRMFTQMLDQQMAQKIANTGNGMGLAESLTQQLMRAYEKATPPTAEEGKEQKGIALKKEGVFLPLPNGESRFIPLPKANTEAVPIPLDRAAQPAALPAQPAALPAQPAALPAQPAALPAKPSAAASSGDARREFVDRMWPHAVEAGQALGVPPHFLIAQAALESGWGKAEIRGGDGQSSFNLFGIKAGSGWKGGVVQAATTEYVNGQPQARTEPFRAYGSYAEAFRDYAGLIAGNPRYAAVLENAADPAAFARELQKAGYATDPMYAAKLSRIMASNAFRDALAG